MYEGVNNQNANQATLHTASGCTQTDNTLNSDCSSGSGCGVEFGSNSFGSQINNGGGVFAMQYATTGVYVWFWARSDAPTGTTQGDSSSIDISSWPEPQATFNFGDSCPSTMINTNQQVTMNIDLCGPWVESSTNGCNFGSSCEDYVANADLSDSYFDINR